MKKTAIAVGCLTLVAGGLSLPTAAQAAGRVFYVSPHGSDSARGTAGHPWRTVSRGMRALRAGDTLYLRGGVYDEKVVGRNGAYLVVSRGTAARPVTVRNYPGERPVIRGLLWLADMDYWTLRGVNVTWASANPAGTFLVRFKNGRGWRLTRSEIWGARGYANVNVTSSRPGLPAGWRITRSCIHDNYGLPAHGTAKDQLLYVNTGLDAGPGAITRNVLFNSPRGKGIKLAGPAPGSGSARVAVRYNTVFNTYKPSITVGYATRASVIARNLVVKTADKSVIRGFRLSGSGNVARDNGFAQAPRAIFSDPGYGARIADLGGNIRVGGGFDRVGCNGLRPLDGRARAFGRYAP